MDQQQAYIDQIIAEHKRNVCEGKFYEPRIWFDSIDFSGAGAQLERSDPNSFLNGEDWPVQITHLLFFVRATSGESGAGPLANGDERLLSRYLARVDVHDTFYMASGLRDQGALIPLWQNKCSAPVDAVGRAVSTWRFPKPFILGSRDTMIVRCTLELSVEVSPRTVGASFTGYGLISNRPYFWQGSASLTAANVEVEIDPDSFRNDAGEPVIVTDVSLFCGGEDGTSDPTGDIQQMRVEIRQAVSGTGAWWTQGPSAPAPPLRLAPAGLFGVSAGRAVVHELPQGGWLFQPGMSAIVELVALDPTQLVRIGVAFAGHAIIT